MRRRWLAASALAGALLIAESAGAQAPENKASAANFSTAIRSGAPILELRPRYESAAQSGAPDAEALTLRTRLGWRTAKWRNLEALIEFEDVRALTGDYNDGVPPAEPFATIADPEGTEINRLQLAWTPNDKAAVTLGRQRIVFDDQRFIGAVAWRQDEQTFDALRLDADFGAIDIAYAYVDHVNRVFGEALDWESESHLVNASYAFGAPMRLAAFVYALDFPDPASAAANSNITYGLRATGRFGRDALKLAYAASYALQSDYGANPFSYEAEYLAAELSATWGPATARIAFESLEGDGPNQRFQTPLATLHAFQGWADVFLITPNDGIDDLNGSLILRPAWRSDHLFNIEFLVRAHEFEAERTGADLGSEIDLSASAHFTEKLSGLIKYADYDGTGAPVDTTRVWVGFEYRL
jgi:hypothetical protein